MSKQLSAHEAAGLFPLMDEEQYANLKKSISAKGLRTPILICQGKILDGRNRYRACMELGVEPKFEEYKGDSPVQEAVTQNLDRNHYTITQKATVANDIIAPLAKEAKARMESGKNQWVSPAPISEQATTKGRAAEIAADIVGVGKTAVYEARRVQKENPEDYAKLKSGEKTLQDIRRERKGRNDEAMKLNAKATEIERAMLGRKGKRMSSALLRAEEAIAVLKRIPFSDELRQRAFDTVINWIEVNRGQ